MCLNPTPPILRFKMLWLSPDKYIGRTDFVIYAILSDASHARVAALPGVC